MTSTSDRSDWATRGQDRRRKSVALRRFLVLLISLVGVLLSLGLADPAPGVGLLLLALGVNEYMLWRIQRRLDREILHLGQIAAAMTGVLEAQDRLSEDQQQQIANLESALSDNTVYKQVWGRLSEQTRPNLEALVERLQQAQDLLPEMVPQTRAWVSEIRRLADRAQASLDSLADQVTWR